MTEFDSWVEEVSNEVWGLLGEDLEDFVSPDALKDWFDEGYNPVTTAHLIYEDYYEGDQDE